MRSQNNEKEWDQRTRMYPHRTKYAFDKQKEFEIFIGRNYVRCLSQIYDDSNYVIPFVNVGFNKKKTIKMIDWERCIVEWVIRALKTMCAICHQEKRVSARFLPFLFIKLATSLLIQSFEKSFTRRAQCSTCSIYKFAADKHHTLSSLTMPPECRMLWLTFEPP